MIQRLTPSLRRRRSNTVAPTRTRPDSQSSRTSVLILATRQNVTSFSCICSSVTSRVLKSDLTSAPSRLVYSYAFEVFFLQVTSSLPCPCSHLSPKSPIFLPVQRGLIAVLWCCVNTALDRSEGQPSKANKGFHFINKP